MKIAELFIKIGKWFKKWFWDKPTSKPPKEKPVRLKATEVINEYVVVEYHGKPVNLHISQVPIWEKLSRKDKRAMADRMARQVKEGKIRFEKVNGKLTCLKNKDYDALAEQAKQKK